MFCAEPWFLGVVAGGITAAAGLIGSFVGMWTERKKQEECSVPNRRYYDLEDKYLAMEQEVFRLRRWERRQCPHCLRFAADDHVCKPRKTHEWPAYLPDPEKYDKKQIVHLEPNGDTVDGQPVCARVYYDRVRLRTKGGTRWIWRRRAG